MTTASDSVESTTPGSEPEVAAPERIKLLRGKRWPTDRYGDEIDVGDYVMCVIWGGYPTARLARVKHINRGGKVKVQAIKTHPRDDTTEQEVKECRYMTKLSQNMVTAMTLDKLANL